MRMTREEYSVICRFVHFLQIQLGPVVWTPTSGQIVPAATWVGWDKLVKAFDEAPLPDRLSPNSAFETVACGICGRQTPMLGTKRCDRCYELESRVLGDPDLARKILRRDVVGTDEGPSCPHIRTSDEGTSYCTLAESRPSDPPILTSPAVTASGGSTSSAGLGVGERPPEPEPQGYTCPRCTAPVIPIRHIDSDDGETVQSHIEWRYVPPAESGVRVPAVPPEGPNLEAIALRLNATQDPDEAYKAWLTTRGDCVALLNYAVTLRAAFGARRATEESK